MVEFMEIMNDKPTCIVVDTNVLIDSMVLRDPLGAALLYEIIVMKLAIAMPEIVELELKKHYSRLCNESIEKIRDGFARIEKLTGSRDDYQVPNSEQIEIAYFKRLEQLKPFIFEIAFTESHARRALSKVMDELPPNGYKNQQFKDSCIWEAIMDIAGSHDVHFITEDNGFFEKTDKNKLAENLQKEVDESHSKIIVHRGIKSFLNQIRASHPGFDYDKLLEHLDDSLRGVVSKNQINWSEMIEIVDKNLIVYCTEDHVKLAVSFEVFYNISFLDTNSNSNMSGIGKIAGECLYSLDDDSITDMHLDYVENYSPERILISRSIYIRGSSAGGRNIIKYQLRDPLQS